MAIYLSKPWAKLQRKSIPQKHVNGMLPQDCKEEAAEGIFFKDVSVGKRG